MTKRFQLLLLFCITLLMHSAFSQNWGELKLTAGDGAFGDNFGWSVAISGNRLIVGAPQDDSNGSSSGSAYIFVNTGSGWVEEAKLIPSDGASSNWFGSSVDIDSNYAVVGAPYNPGQPGRGRAYIFKYQGGAWVEQAQLVPEDTSIGTFFGISVSISGEYALIGAYWENGVSSSSGAAYIFHRSDTIWTRQAHLLASDGESFDHFGNAVALDGDYAIIGAKDDNDNGNNSGSAYVFHREGHAWMEQAKLLASDGNSQDNFGVSVAIKGSLAIVGANMLFNYLTGAAYIFRRDSTHWNEIAKLTASDVASRDEFGISVDISEGFALVGATRLRNLNIGAAYLFRDSSGVWQETMKFTPGDGTGIDGYGTSVALQDSSEILVSSPQNNGVAPYSGAAYLYESTVVAIPAPRANDLPSHFTLYQNYPNPFNPVTDIKFAIPEAAKVKIEIFNTLGQRVTTLIDKQLQPGEYTITWNSTDLNGNAVSSGVYIYRLTTDNFQTRRKMILIR